MSDDLFIDSPPSVLASPSLAASVFLFEDEELLLI